MQNEKKWRTVGKVKDAHGLKGELFILLFSKEAAWLKRLKELTLIASEGAEQKQYKVKSARLHKNGLIVLSSDVHGRNAAEDLRGHLLQIPEEYLVSQKGEALFLAEIEGFTVHTKEQGELGPVEGFSYNGAQDLLVVRTKTGEFEIPFVDAFVEKIDYNARAIFMNLPFGLLGEETGEEAPEISSENPDDEPHAPLE